MTKSSSFRRVFSAACIGMLMFGIVIITLGSILPSLIDKFRLNEVSAGTLTSLLPFGILIGSLLFGPIADRYSYKYLLVVCSILIVAGLQGIAFTENIFLLQGSLLSIGVGGGAINGGTNALVADICASKGNKRSAYLSLLGVFFGIGALGMPMLLGALSEHYDLYQIIAWVGLLMVIPILLFLLTRFPQAKQTHSVPLGQSLKLVKDLNLVLLGLILFFQSGIEGIINNWSTLFLEVQRNFIQEQALYALGIFVLSLTLTRIALTFLLHYIKSYQVLLISVGIATVGALWMLAAGQIPGSEMVGLIMLGAGLSAGFPVVLGYVGAMYPGLSGTAFSLVLVIALSGNILWNFLTGIISKSLGIGVYPLLLLICLICMSILLLVTIKRTLKNNDN